MEKTKIILSAGGTGGHIYPAIAVAEELERQLEGKVEFLFVGAEGKMEMDRVPACGYKIVGLPVVGIQRKLSLSNFSLPFKVWKSVRKARGIIKEFDADVVVGFGGYASGPVLWSGQRMKLPTLIQEQNSYAGVTNKILGKKANKICVAYDNMERFFPAERIIKTGNPLRGVFEGLEQKRDEALAYFGLSADKPVILIVGGSLGTRTLNEVMKKWVDKIVSDGEVQVIWQTGKFYLNEMTEFAKQRNMEGIWQGAFIDRMDYAYAAANVVISRSGALSVSELSLMGKPTIFVPSPNVAEDHQTKNAMALVEKDAALMVKDNEAIEKVIPVALELLENEKHQQSLSENIKANATPNATKQVAQEIIALI